tara:strand:- start:621 stop:1007 length:387 start_codon:yes stop_codon:yes gene_type:complete
MNDKELIEQCIRIYYEGLCESDPLKIKKVFDKNAMIYGFYQGDEVFESNGEDYASNVDKVQPSPREMGERELLEIISVEIQIPEFIANVELRRAHLGEEQWVKLLFLKKTSQSSWRIYTEIFHTEVIY